MSQPRAFYRIGVISDTHGTVAPSLFEIFDGVELILHSGDLGNDSVLIELEAIAPVSAVSGNVDGEPHPTRRPLERQLTTPAGRIAMTHGHLLKAPAVRKDLLVAYFSPFGPDIIIYGHTHVPFLGEVVGVTLFNPGVAGRVRASSPPSVGLITVANEGDPPRLEHVELKG
jgi:putative phosphoesterase